jgi:tetratricopeptide (TPR) repeat protein
MRIALALVISAACGRTGARPDDLASLDLAEASVRIRAMVDGCDGFNRALDRLSASGISGRSLAGLVDDAVDAAGGRCTTTKTGTAHLLAHARLLDDRPADALAVLPATTSEPAIHFRRAELLDRQGRTREALGELDAAIARVADPAALATRRRLQITDDVRSRRHADAARKIAAAPLSDRPALAHRAVADAALAELDALAGAAAEPELATAVAERLERERGPVAALAARERAAASAPDRAEHQDALGRALAAAGRIDDALAAWDRAAAAAPAQPAYRLAPVRALVALEHRARARTRAIAIIEAARAGDDVDALLTASAAAAAIGDPKLAVELAREAQRKRPGDGRLAFTVAERLVEAGDRAAAAAAFSELLVCGAHNRPWHRHEVAGRLLALATDAASARLVIAALAARRACSPIDPPDLARYVDALRGKLAELAR